MKNIKFTNFSIFGILIGLILVFASPDLSKAQQTLSEGGDSFETATLIQPGKYQGGALNEEVGLEKYYYIEGIKPGQEVKIKVVFYAESTTYGTINKIAFYNENKEELIDMSETNYSSVALSASWLPNSDQSTYKYYIKVADEWGGTKSFTLDISLIEHYDAASQTDAGDFVDKALTVVAPGTYQGYLAGCYGCLPFEVREGGTDFKDFYKVAVKRGQNLTIKITPPSEAKMELAVYDTKRQLIKSEEAKNPGAIISTSLDIVNDGDVFVAVICEDSPKLVAYTLDIAVAAPPGEKPVIGPDGQPPSKKSGIGGVWPTFIPSTLFWKGMVIYMILSWIVLIILYIYFALCLYLIAKKTGTANAWLAWIPIANVFLMIQIAQKPLWWFILLLIPLVNIIIGVILWMKIAERRGKPNWVGILIIVPFIGFIIPGYLAFSNKEKIEITPPYMPTGTQEAHKPVVGYKHPCKYCGKLIPPNSTTCPFCGKINPLGPFRCPKCHEPVEKDWKACSRCGQDLRIVCPFCNKTTFFGDYCEDCGARLLVKCPHCGQEQPPLGDNCINCGKPLYIKVEK